MTTAKVVKLVEHKRSGAPEAFQGWFSEIAELTEQAKQALMIKKWQVFFRILERQQELFSKIGVTNQDINEIIGLCKRYKTVLATKISGSGLGDCILCLGKLPVKTFPLTVQQKERGVQQFNLELSVEGVLIHPLNGLMKNYG